MKKIIIIILLFYGINQLINSQDFKIMEVLQNMPKNEILYGIEGGTLQFLLDKPDEETRKSSSSLYSNIERKNINDTYISLQTSKLGSTQIKLLPLINDSYIICVVKSICGTICDSQITFYTDNWKQIETEELFPEIDASMFMTQNNGFDSTNYQRVYSILNDNLPLYLQLYQDEDNISMKIYPSNYLDSDTYKEIKPYLNENQNDKKLFWDKKSFKENLQ